MLGIIVIKWLLNNSHKTYARMYNKIRFYASSQGAKTKKKQIYEHIKAHAHTRIMYTYGAGESTYLTSTSSARTGL